MRDSNGEPFLTPDAWLIGLALAGTAALAAAFYWAVRALPELVHMIGFLALGWVVLVTAAAAIRFLSGKPR